MLEQRLEGVDAKLIQFGVVIKACEVFFRVDEQREVLHFLQHWRNQIESSELSERLLFETICSLEEAIRNAEFGFLWLHKVKERIVVARMDILLEIDRVADYLKTALYADVQWQRIQLEELRQHIDLFFHLYTGGGKSCRRVIETITEVRLGIDSLATLADEKEARARRVIEYALAIAAGGAGNDR